MANMNVTYAELQQVASQLQSGQGELEGILGKLQSLVEQLVSAGFQTDQASGAGSYWYVAVPEQGAAVDV